MEPLRIGLVQSELAWEDPIANRSHFESLLLPQAGKLDMVVLPEMFTTGFTMDPRGKGERTHGPTAAWMQSLASRTGATLLGSLIVEEAGQFYNRLLAVDATGIRLTYDKRHLFRMAGEDEQYRAGTEKPVLTIRGWKVCPLICYDLRFPVWSRNRSDAQGQAAYDILLYVANWPEKRIAHWSALLKARAIENQAYCLGVNRVGEDGNGIAYSGDSAIINYVGEVLATCTGKPALLTATLDKEALVHYRERFPAWQDADGFRLD